MAPSIIITYQCISISLSISMRRCSHRSEPPAPPIILQILTLRNACVSSERPRTPLDDDKKEGAEGEGEDDKRRSARRQPTRRLRRNPPSADGWGDRYSPSWRERSPPIRTASPAARNRSRWATASAIHGAGWRLSTGERRRKLRLSYFLSPAQKRVSRFWAKLSYITPIWMGGDNVVGAIIFITHPTAGSEKGVCPARLIHPADGCRTKRGANEMTAGDRESPRDRASPTVARCGLLRRKRSCSRS